MGTCDAVTFMTWDQVQNDTSIDTGRRHDYVQLSKRDICHMNIVPSDGFLLAHGQEDKFGRNSIITLRGCLAVVGIT